jgi:predicted ArsR family transcriptional regulator
MISQQTSEEALASLEPHLDRLEKIVLSQIDQHPMTCDEVESQTGLSHQTASARIRALAQRELINATDERRKTRSGRKAIVWQRWGLV